MTPIKARDKSLQSIRVNKMELNFVNKFVKESGENKQNFLEKKFLEVIYHPIYFGRLNDFFESENYEALNNSFKFFAYISKKYIKNIQIDQEYVKILQFEATNQILEDFIFPTKKLFEDVIVKDEQITFKIPKNSNSVRKYSLGFRIEEKYKSKWEDLKNKTRLSKREILLRMVQGSQLITIEEQNAKPINEFQANVGKASGCLIIIIRYAKQNPEIFSEEDIENLEKLYKELRETKKIIVEVVNSKRKDGRIFIM